MNPNQSQCPQCGSDPVRLPRIDVSASQLAAALRDAQAAHHVYEETLGHADANWADWYAGYIVSGHAPSLQPVVTTVSRIR